MAVAPAFKNWSSTQWNSQNWAFGWAPPFADIASNDYMVVYIRLNNNYQNTGTITPPAGWTAIYNQWDDNQRFAVFGKKLTAGEVIGSFTMDGGGNYHQGACLAFLYTNGDRISNYTYAIDASFPSNAYVIVPGLNNPVASSLDFYLIDITRAYGGEASTYYNDNAGAASGFTWRTSGVGDRQVASAGSMPSTTDGHNDAAGGSQRYRVVRLTIAPLNSAPSNPGTPSVSPNPVDKTGTISWAASSDPDGNTVYYTVELSTNGGSTWTRIRSDQTGNSFTYDFTNVAATKTALVRVYASDLQNGTGWITSTAFEVKHGNYMPRIMP